MKEKRNGPLSLPSKAECEKSEDRLMGSSGTNAAFNPCVSSCKIRSKTILLPKDEVNTAWKALCIKNTMDCVVIALISRHALMSGSIKIPFRSLTLCVYKLNSCYLLHISSCLLFTCSEWNRVIFGRSSIWSIPSSAHPAFKIPYFSLYKTHLTIRHT